MLSDLLTFVLALAVCGMAVLCVYCYRPVSYTHLDVYKRQKHFNDVLGGLQRGCLYIIAARPGDGKTDFALHLACLLYTSRCV